MADDRSVFERLDSIEATGVENNKMLAELLGILQNQPASAPVQPQQQYQPQPSDQEVFREFLKKAKKSWRWFGSVAEYKKSKTLATISLFILLIVGLITSIVSTICFKMYSTFTFFENAWMIISIIYLVYTFNTQFNYEVGALASNSPDKYRTDELGMKFPIKERTIFRIIRWLAIISVPANIICIWAGMGINNRVLAMIMELLFLGTIVFAYFMVSNHFNAYCIVWVEGRNLVTNEKVVLVLPPGAKQLIPEEEFKKKMPFFY